MLSAKQMGNCKKEVYYLYFLLIQNRIQKCIESQPCCHVLYIITLPHLLLPSKLFQPVYVDPLFIGINRPFKTPRAHPFKANVREAQLLCGEGINSIGSPLYRYWW